MRMVRLFSVRAALIGQALHVSCPIMVVLWMMKGGLVMHAITNAPMDQIPSVVLTMANVSLNMNMLATKQGNFWNLLISTLAQQSANVCPVSLVLIAVCQSVPMDHIIVLSVSMSRSMAKSSVALLVAAMQPA